MTSKKQHDRLTRILAGLIIPETRYVGDIFHGKKYTKTVEKVHESYEPREALLSSPDSAKHLRDKGKDIKVDASGRVYLETVQRVGKNKQLCLIDFDAVAAIGSLVKGPMTADDWCLISAVIAASRVWVHHKYHNGRLTVYSQMLLKTDSLKDPVKTYV